MRDRAAEMSAEELVLYWAVVALPALVTLAIGTTPFSTTGAIVENPFVYPKILVLALGVAVGASAWAVGVVRGTIGVRTVPGGWWLAAFLALATLSTAFALNPESAFFGWKYARIGLMVILLVSAEAVLTIQVVTTAGADASYRLVDGCGRRASGAGRRAAVPGHRSCRCSRVPTP